MNKERNKYRPSLVDLGIFLCGVVSGFLIGFPWNWFLRDVPEANAADSVSNSYVEFRVDPLIMRRNLANSALSVYYVPFNVRYNYGSNIITFPDNVTYVNALGNQFTVSPSVTYSGNALSAPEYVNVQHLISESNGRQTVSVYLTFGQEGFSPFIAFVTVDYYTLPSTTYLYVDLASSKPFTTIYFSEATSSSSIQSAYDEGKRAGKIEGDAEGYARGKAEGLELAENSSFTDLMNAVFYAPAHTLYSVLNFEVLGVNMFDLFAGILSALLIIGIVALVVKLIRG